MNAKRRRTVLGVGALAALLYALWRLLEARQRESAVTWEPQPFPMPPRPRPAAPTGPERAAEPATAAAPEVVAPEGATDGPAWIDPVDGACPASHPVKAKLASGIYHLPGMQMYERTRADRCYADPAAAEADGLRASKR